MLSDHLITAGRIAADALDGKDSSGALTAMDRQALEGVTRHLIDMWAISARVIADHARIDYAVVAGMLRDALPADVQRTDATA